MLGGLLKAMGICIDRWVTEQKAERHLLSPSRTAGAPVARVEQVFGELALVGVFLLTIATPLEPRQRTST